MSADLLRQKAVIVASRTHELRLFTGPAEDAREFAAGLVEQLRDQGPASRNPYVPTPRLWTPENWRDSKDKAALNFRQGVTSCAWFGPAGFEIRIEDALSAPLGPADAPSDVTAGTEVHGGADGPERTRE